MAIPETTIGKSDSFHVTVRQSFLGIDGVFDITIWPGSHGMTVAQEVRDQDKAVRIAQYLYDELLPEHVAWKERQRKQMQAFEEKQRNNPKPKPVKVLRNAPKVDVLECSECNALVLPDEVSDERVYECGECGTSGAGDDARRCDQCHKFTAKVSDTSCPECSAPFDDAETVQAQKATNGEWVKIER